VNRDEKEAFLRRFDDIADLVQVARDNAEEGKYDDAMCAIEDACEDAVKVSSDLEKLDDEAR